MEIQLPVNNDNILGTGNGSNIEYEIVAKYGKPLLLDTTPFTGDGFLGWYKNGGKISDEYTGFGDGDIIEARFGKVITINVKHIGNGHGETKVVQDYETKGQSNGGTNYSATIIDSTPIQVSETYDSDTVEFKGWQDVDGKSININTLVLVDGMTIYAEFVKKLIGITIRHKGAIINSTTTQDSIVLGNKIGNDTSYVVNAEVNSDLNISHSVGDAMYKFVDIKDEIGQTYSSNISSSSLRPNMSLTITYILDSLNITVNHVGAGRGHSSVSQGSGNEIGNGNGGSGTSYPIQPIMSQPFTIDAIADTHYELIEIQDGNGTVLGNTLQPSEYYEGMVINIIFGFISVPPQTGGNDGSNIYHEQTYNLGSTAGRVDIDYSMGGVIPDKMEIWYNGVMVLSTDSVAGNTTEQWMDASGVTHTEGGFVASTGTLSFNYIPTNFDYSLKVVIKPAISSGTYWTYTVHPPV